MKALEKITEPHFSNIKEAVYSLANNPRPNGYIKLKGRDGYCIRATNYRIMYDIFDNELLINIIDLGNRKDVYSS